MPTRNVVLTEEQDRFVARLVETGRFQNASEALRTGLRLLEQEETELAALQARLQAAVREYDNGERAEGTGEEVIRRAFASVLGS
ncbi:type II toxin-antitoxin system ParD family antitoxin [Anianabacter salinae]|uniref:type II toxin-antitoxin system ParD family antitoxin n=1 Tax=Anianabacter salinae TaxID=2851023 RepID=UPI00225E0458|nr:type II toxin-antitoxin system ParD family antitoxin [Anianabacter salinae]MBV0912585.1 type II toxin-antitoxin system ParD family antitoxin [Anianabacter salinae]